jgi:hypothetical protein
VTVTGDQPGQGFGLKERESIQMLIKIGVFLLHAILKNSKAAHKLKSDYFSNLSDSDLIEVYLLLVSPKSKTSENLLRFLQIENTILVMVI